MPTPDTKRTPPPRLFKNYILTREEGVGLTQVPAKKFVQVSGIVGAPWSTADSSFSAQIDIGFNFSINNVNYKKFIVSTNGWLVLVAPGGLFSLTDIFNAATASQNNRILNNFSRDHLLIAPWFDDLRNLTDSLEPAYSQSPYPVTDPETLSNYNKGYLSPTVSSQLPNLDPLEFGVRYHLQESSHEGRRMIVRWDSVALVGTNLGSTIRFEVVIQENGVILMNYAPRSTFKDFYVNESTYPDTSSATIGIFKNRSTLTFRDFSVGLGYRDAERQQYVYGGAIYNSSYTDNTSPYTISLKFSKHWPAPAEKGCTFRFAPPPLLRKVLPRKDIRLLDSESRLPTISRTGDSSRSGVESSYYDDRTTVNFVQSVVSYPTTLPRFYGDGVEGISDRQSLFASNFLVTASISKSAIEGNIGNKNKKFLAPFNEYKLFENDHQSSSNRFYSEGTPASEVGEGFSSPLKSKTQIRLNFRVDEKTTLFGASSSIYYYNSEKKRWQYPAKAAAADPTGGNELPNPAMDIKWSPTRPSRIIEIDKCFNAPGFMICSGSSPRNYGGGVKFNGTEKIFNTGWTDENESLALSGEYKNSFSVRPAYDATDQEKFSISIQQPFLLEKAVIELPLEAGPAWFQDKTQCFLPIRPPAGAYSLVSPFGQWVTNSLGDENSNAFSSDEDLSYRSNAFDIGGPAITVGLFNNVRTGINTYRRELILSGTVTHYQDYDTEIKLYDYELDEDESWQVVPRGIKAYGTPTVVLNPTTQKSLTYGMSSFLGDYFTGSVKLECQPTITNGVVVRDTIYLNHAASADLTKVENIINQVFNTPVWQQDKPLTHFGSNSTFSASNGDWRHVLGFREKTIVGVNNLGRAATGFGQSGRSYFGRDYTADSENSYNNPFYLYDKNDVQTSLINKINEPTFTKIPKIFITQVHTDHSTKVSPYLLLPGDKLSLTVSKTRPFTSSSIFPYVSGSDPFTSTYFGNFEHDIKMSTGSINITLYGSLISDGVEYHDTLNQLLSSDSTHEIIGGDPWR